MLLVKLSLNTAVLLIAFNRPETTQLVFDQIRKAAPRKLFIAIDGPRNNLSDEEKVTQVKQIVENITWECEVKKMYQLKNLGCSQGPRAAIKWFFGIEETGIILEDDCLPNGEFFNYCEILLEKYKGNNKILNVCGSNMGDNRSDASGYFFSRFMNMSGWATWRRSVEEIDYDLAAWKNGSRSIYPLYKALRQDVFDADIDWYNYWKHKFNLTIESKNVTWWDWQWIYHQIFNKQLSIIPNRNLVSNIGFNENATHTKDAGNLLANIPLQTMLFPLHHPSVIKPDFKYEENFVKWVWCDHKRIMFIYKLKQKFIQLIQLK